MSPGDRNVGIQRILVGLDASPQSLAALEAAAQLASRFGAELACIFVEDINLLRVANLPFAREVSRYSANLRQLDSPHIERQLRAQARLVKQKITNLAERLDIRWSFRIARGVIPVELLDAAQEADLVLLGKTGWSRRRQVGSTTRVMVVQSPRHTLILQQRVRQGLPILVAYDGSEAGQKALAVASMFWIEGSSLTVLLLAADPEEAHQLQSEAQAQLEAFEMEAQYSWRPNMTSLKLARLARAEGCGILVVPAESEQLSGEIGLTILNETECAVLLAR